MTASYWNWVLQQAMEQMGQQADGENPPLPPAGEYGVPLDPNSSGRMYVGAPPAPTPTPIPTPAPWEPESPGVYPAPGYGVGVPLDSGVPGAAGSQRPWWEDFWSGVQGALPRFTPSAAPTLPLQAGQPGGMPYGEGLTGPGYQYSPLEYAGILAGLGGPSTADGTQGSTGVANPLDIENRPGVTTEIDENSGGKIYYYRGAPFMAVLNGKIQYAPGGDKIARMLMFGDSEAQVVDRGTYLEVRQRDGTVSVVNKPTRAAGAQFDWSKSEGGTRAGWAHEDEKASKTALEKTLADERAAELARDLKRIEAKTELTKSERDLEKQRLINTANKEINDALLEFKRWEAGLLSQGKELDRAAQKAIAEGNWALARFQTESAEKIAQARAAVERELGALKLYGELLSVEAMERTKRAASAANVFQVLANLAPRDQLRSAVYAMRGLAPPPSTITQLPAGLLAALGVNPDTATAAAQQLRGQISAPPWMVKLFGGNLA